MNYFVTINGDIISRNLRKKEAIQKAKSLTNSFNIGIGKIKCINGKKKYILLPANFYFN
jgi:uncharacterized membrane protein